MADAAPLKATALNAVHRALGARMVDFGGWDMPVPLPGLFSGSSFSIFSLPHCVSARDKLDLSL